MYGAAIRLLGTLLLTCLLAASAAAQGWLVEEVAIQGDSAPGTAGGTYSGFLSSDGQIPAELDDAGNVYFIAFITGGDTSRVIARGTPAGVVPLVRGGDPAPPSGFFGVLTNLAVSGSGLLAFSVTTPLTGLFLDDGVTLSRVINSGDPSPAGGTLSPGSRPDVNDSATIAFWAFEGGVVPVTEGIFITAGGVETAIARNSSDIAPLTGGATYAAFRRRPTLNDTGDVVFTALLSGGTTSDGIFRHDATLGSVVKVAVIGDTAPGTGGGTFSVFGNSPVALDDDGTVTFRAMVAGGSASDGTFAVGPGGAVSRVLVGDTAPETGGDTFNLFSSPTVNKGGSMAFAALTFSSGVGLFLQVDSSEAAVAFNGESAPGTGGGTFSPGPNRRPDVNDGGVFAFLSAVIGGSALNGIFVARRAAPVPLLPGPGLAAAWLLLAAAAAYGVRRSQKTA